MSLDLDLRSKFLCDRYYLDDLLALTSHSKIYLARDLAFKNRRCVVKQMYPSYCPVEKRQTIELAFRQEAKILKQVKNQHQQICQYYNHFSDRGHLYLVQEWIEGTTLIQDLHQRRKLSEYETKTILLDLLPAIECVHGLGIIHNDINPSNIIIRSADKLPVLIDFGIAQEIKIHQPQTISGTLGYMSPQQAMGRNTYGNDLYSLGLTAIHLLTGKSPQTIDFNSPQNNFWEQEKTAFDPQLVAVIDRAIATNPNRRFASALEMSRALQFSESKSKLSLSPTETNQSFPNLTLWLLGVTMSVLTVGAFFTLPYLMPPLNYKPPVDLLEPLTVDPPLPKDNDPQVTALAATNNQLEKMIFIPGTSESEIIQALGEPLWRKPGFWANSMAWSYEDIVSPGFDIGYMFDRSSNLLRQAEIAVPSSTELSTVKVAMKSFLATGSLPNNIEQGLQAVHQRQQNTYSFSIANLQGIVQRNQSDRIYLAVWEAGFHQ